MHRDHFKDFMFKKIQFRVSAHKILLLTVVHIVLRCLYGGAMAVVLVCPITSEYSDPIWAFQFLIKNVLICTL